MQRGEDTDDEDNRIIADIHSWTALHVKSRLAFTRLMDAPAEEVARETAWVSGRSKATALRLSSL